MNVNPGYVLILSEFEARFLKSLLWLVQSDDSVVQDIADDLEMELSLAGVPFDGTEMIRGVENAASVEVTAGESLDDIIDNDEGAQIAGYGEEGLA